MFPKFVILHINFENIFKFLISKFVPNLFISSEFINENLKSPINAPNFSFFLFFIYIPITLPVSFEIIGEPKYFLSKSYFLLINLNFLSLIISVIFPSKKVLFVEKIKAFWFLYRYVSSI